MKYKKCEICGLRSERKDGVKRFFMARFPLDELRCKIWVKMTGNEDLAYIPIEKLHELKFVCGKHFKDKDFKKKKTQLKITAVPSIRLTAEPLSDEKLIEFPCHISRESKEAKKDAPSTSSARNASFSLVTPKHTLNANENVRILVDVEDNFNECDIPLVDNGIKVFTSQQPIPEDNKREKGDNIFLEERISEKERNDEVPSPADDSVESPEIPATPAYKETVSNQPTNKNQEIYFDRNILDNDILKILGDDPTSTIQYGPEIHKELASRLQHIATSGLSKEARNELQQKYLLPSNGVLWGAPSLNPEIKAALTETLLKHDKALEAKQKLLASAISCVASVTSQILSSSDRNNDLLKKLMDANKILCDIQHSHSYTRRMFNSSALKKDVRSQVLSSKIDKLLFGQNLPGTLKAAKAVSKSGAEIKNTININKRPAPSTTKASNLISKRPAAPARKSPAVPVQTRQEFSNQNRPARSTKTSLHAAAETSQLPPINEVNTVSCRNYCK